MFLGKLTGSTALVVLAFLDCSQAPAAVGVMVLGVALGGIQMFGFGVNHIDIAPRYAGTLYGISNTAACVSGFLVPYIVSVLTHNVSYTRIIFLFVIHTIVLFCSNHNNVIQAVFYDTVLYCNTNSCITCCLL